jgi:CcmD family protein
MGHWGFVFLAYGIVWSAILLYLTFLNCRLNRANGERALLEGLNRSEDNE